MEMIYYLFCVLVISLFSVILHEVMHGFVAYKLGDDTAKISGRLSLNPLRHIDPMMSIIIPLFFAICGMPILGGAKPVPINKHKLKFGDWGFALVAIAGPLTNFVLSFVFFLVYYFVPSGIIETFALYGMQINLSLMLFNLIPISPLDGSRVLRALAPESIQGLMDKIESFGFIVLYILLLVGGAGLSTLFINAENGILSAFFWIVGAR